MQARLNFGDRQESGDQQLAGASPLAINVLIDGKGSVRRRPGITAWDGFPATIPEASQVDGISTFKGNVFYLNQLRRMHYVAGGTDVPLYDGTADSTLGGMARPVFAETKFRLVAAGGLRPLQWVNGAGSATQLGASQPALYLPPPSTHVAALSSRLFLNDLTGPQNIGQFRGSGVGQFDEEKWDPLVFFEAEARPDDIQGLYENTNEAFVFGQSTLQIFAPDPTVIMAPGRTRNLGLAAPYSPIRTEDQFAWLDNQRRFMMSDGRQTQDISAPISRVLDTIEVVTDCWGMRYNADQFDVLVWVFPTDGRAFAYQAGVGWSQWQGWTTARGHVPWSATAHKFVEESNLHLVGLETGQVAELTTSVQSDLGQPFKAEVQTGFIDHDSTSPKHCEMLRLVLQRGQAAGTPTLMLSWRDDLGDFTTPILVSLGAAGDNTAEVDVRSLGTYYRRQWKVEFAAQAEFVLVAAEEFFTVGGTT